LKGRKDKNGSQQSGVSSQEKYIFCLVHNSNSHDGCNLFFCSGAGSIPGESDTMVERDVGSRVNEKLKINIEECRIQDSEYRMEVVILTTDF
jgi:hypothetical protein